MYQKNKEKDILLIKTLEALSKENNLNEKEKRDKYYKEFKKIYNDGYRHNYSSIYTFIIKLTDTQVKKNNCNDPNLKDGILVTLSANLYNILEYSSTEKKDDEINLKLGKLYDHISLERARKSTYKKLLKNYEKINSEVDRAKKLIDKSNAKAKELQKEVENSKKEYVSILGIFASIVLGFTGALSFTSSAFENILEVNIFKLLAITIVVGWIIVKLLELMLNLIYYSMGKEPIEDKSNKIINFDTTVILLLFILGVFYICVTY